MNQLPFYLSKLYKMFTNKKLLTAIIILTALLLVSGFPAYIVMLASQGKATIATPDDETTATMIRHVAFTPVAALLYAVGFIGLLGMANTKNPRYTRFAPLCYGFICVSYGCLILLEKVTLGL